jgi:hypothetical protein
VKAGCFAKHEPPGTVGYIGCFIDDKKRDLNKIKTSKDNMNYENCKNFCTGYRFMGLQFAYV